MNILKYRIVLKDWLFLVYPIVLEYLVVSEKYFRCHFHGNIRVGELSEPANYQSGKLSESANYPISWNTQIAKPAANQILDYAIRDYSKFWIFAHP